MNKVVLVGRITKDVEVRATQSGKSVCAFTLAIDRHGKKVEGQPAADFISCVAWDKIAEVLGRFGCKGKRIAVDGRLQSRKYNDKQEVTHYVTEVIVWGMELLDGGDKSGQQGGNVDPDAAFGLDIPF